MNDLSEQEEGILNPAPKSYKPSAQVKILFMALAFVGLLLYGYMLVDRRLMESRHFSHQEILPIKLMPSFMPTLSVIDPVTKTPHNLSFNDGEFTLLNIWATWCPPCRKEMPSLMQLEQKLHGKLRVVALSIDDDVAAIEEFISNENLKLRTFWDKDKQSPKYLSIDKYPETFLISPTGYLTTQFSGPRNWASPEIVDYFLNNLDRP